ncbi:MAG: hypothetical protein FJX34_01080 [Alphaproteobacteria bacterium]|nr:hypothetical protein [Alphaproteobacteria bacterium]
MLIRILVILTLTISTVLAQQQDVNFAEKDLPNAVQAKTDLPDVKPGDAPVKELEINKSTIVTNNTIASLGTILLQQNAVSLMFDDEQNSNIERAIYAFKTNQSFTPESSNSGTEDKSQQKESEVSENEKSYIYLASIIYFGRDDWAVWINNQKITTASNMESNEMYLTDVEPSRVKFLWRISVSKWKILSGQKSEILAPKINDRNQVEIEFELHPNQTFMLTNRNVIEGKAIIALLKKKEVEENKTNSSTSKSKDSTTKAASPTSTMPAPTPTASPIGGTGNTTIDTLQKVLSATQN